MQAHLKESSFVLLFISKQIILHTTPKHNGEPHIHGTLYKKNCECCSSKRLKQQTITAQLSSGSEIVQLKNISTFKPKSREYLLNKLKDQK